MAEPLSVILLTAAVGGAVGGGAGKFVEKSCDAGGRWLEAFWKDHQEKARLKAAENASNLLRSVATEIGFLEAAGTVTAEQLEEALEHPEFSQLMQQAILGAAQTDDQEKHDVLARLIANRLQAQTDGRWALAVKIAVDAVPRLTPNQLRTVAFVTLINYRVPGSKEADRDDYVAFFHRIMEPYRGLDVTYLDAMQLVAVSCGIYSIVKPHSLLAGLKKNLPDGYVVDQSTLERSELYQALDKAWQEQLFPFRLTSAGLALGANVADALSGERNNWASIFG